MKRVLVIALVLALAVSAFAVYSRVWKGTDSITLVTSHTGDASLKLDTVPLVGDASRWKSAVIKIKIGAAYVADAGGAAVGNSDTAYVCIKSSFMDTATNVDSQFFTAIPVNYKKTISSTVNGDSLIRENLFAIIKVADTTSDTVVTAVYPVTWEVITKD